MKTHSSLDCGWGRVVKMATVTSWDRFQAQPIWGMLGDNMEPSPGMFVPLKAIGLCFTLLWLRVQMRH